MTGTASLSEGLRSGTMETDANGTHISAKFACA